MAGFQVRNSVAIEFVQRVSAGLVLLLLGKLAAAALNAAPNAVTYYCGAMVFATIALLFVLRLGRSPLILDLLDICLYDVLVALYGYIAFKIGKSDDVFWTLAATVNYLRVARLVWWGKNKAGEIIARWPIFGLIGLVCSPQHPEGISFRQVVAIYFTCGATILIPIVTWSELKALDQVFYLSPILLAILIATPRVTKLIADTEAAKEAAIREKTALQIQTAMDAHIKERNADLCAATHDLKGPLFGLLHQSYKLENSTNLEQAHAAARNLSAGLHELGDLLSEVIVMAKIVTETITANDEVVDMYALRTRLDRDLVDEANKRGIRLAVYGAKCLVKSNKWLLSRIVANLTINAIVHGKRGCRVVVHTYCRGERCYIVVRDTGNGIANCGSNDRAANFLHLAEQSHRLTGAEPVTGQELLSGHGMGLKSVRRMCHTLGITMTVKARLGVGTKFRFSVPLAPPDTPAPPPPLADLFEQVKRLSEKK